MVSDAMKKAISKYRQENPLKKTYWDRKAMARGFIMVDLKKNTKLSKAINENRIEYIKDLQELRADIDQRLKDLQQ